MKTVLPTYIPTLLLFRDVTGNKQLFCLTSCKIVLDYSPDIANAWSPDRPCIDTAIPGYHGRISDTLSLSTLSYIHTFIGLVGRQIFQVMNVIEMYIFGKYVYTNKCCSCYVQPTISLFKEKKHFLSLGL